MDAPANSLDDDIREFYADGFSPDGSYTYYSFKERRAVTVKNRVPLEAQAAAMMIDVPSDFFFATYYRSGKPEDRVWGVPMPFGRYVLELVPEIFDDIEPAEAVRERKTDAKEAKLPFIIGLSPGYGF